MIAKQNITFKNIVNVLPYRTSIFLMILISGLIIWIHRLFSKNTGGLAWFGDFDNYYITVQMFLSSGQIYGHGYVYPPISILAFLPFGLLSWKNALVLKTIFDVFCYAISLYYIFKILKEYNIEVPIFHRIALFISILLFYPVTVSFVSGSINAQILGFSNMIYYSLFIDNKIKNASALTSVATVIKLIPFDLILLNKKYRIQTTLITATIFLVSILVMGLNIHIEWIYNLIQTQNIGEPSITKILNPIYSYDINSTISVSMVRILVLLGQSIDNIIILLSIFKLAIIVYMIWFINKNYKFNASKETDILYFSLLMILPLILSNTTWIYYWAFFITPIILWAYILRLSKTDKILLFILIFLITMQAFICTLADIIGGTVKTLVYILPPITVASILMFIFIWIKINHSAQRESLEPEG